MFLEIVERAGKSAIGDNRVSESNASRAGAAARLIGTLQSHRASFRYKLAGLLPEKGQLTVCNVSTIRCRLKFGHSRYINIDHFKF